jgi:hypothetical protein
MGIAGIRPAATHGTHISHPPLVLQPIEMQSTSQGSSFSMSGVLKGCLRSERYSLLHACSNVEGPLGGNNKIKNNMKQHASYCSTIR